MHSGSWTDYPSGCFIYSFSSGSTYRMHFNFNLLTEVVSNTQAVGTEAIPLCRFIWPWSANNYVYFLSEVLRTWEDHENKAKEWGGHLVSIHSEEEYNYINDLRGSNSIWIGGTRKSDNPSEWEWSDGTPFNYTNWQTDEPNNELETKIQQGMGECNCWAWNDYLEAETAFAVYKKVTQLCFAIFIVF